MRRPSNAARDLVVRNEGLRLVAYPDPGTGGAPWTIGYGHTGGVRPGDRCTPQQALDFLAADMLEAVATIYRHVPAAIIDALPQACFDALVSFVFNVGAQAFVDSRSGKRTQFYAALVGRDPIEPARQMQRWVKSGGRVMPGLVKRRGEEAALWGAGIESAHATPIDQPTPSTERVIEEMTSSQPDAPAPQRFIQQPGVVAGAAAGAGGVAAAAATLSSAGSSMAMSSDRVVLLIGLALILIGAVAMIWMARR